MTTRVRIRDFVTTSQAWIFSVVSYDSGEGDVKCLLRYIPDESGDRVSENGRYRKLDFHESYAFLSTHQPGYVKDVHEVPKEDITEILRPEERLPRIAEREDGVRDIYELLGKAIPKDRIGITGSFLCGLNNQQSDLDFVVYGQKNFNLARQVIADATKEGLLTGIGQDVWKQIYNKRNPELSYDEFVAQEKRKKNRGVIDNTYFDLLYVRDWAEIRELDRRDYEKGERMGYAMITAEVKNAYFSFDSPAIYEIEHPEISKVLCFTHTYTGQASEGELIEARGVMERTKHETRLVVGTTREAKGEWIKSLSLFEKDKDKTTETRRRKEGQNKLETQINAD